MSKAIKYVATIEKETGRILNVVFPNHSMPEEGVTAEGNTILYINEDNMPAEFMQPQFKMMEWVVLEGEFIHVGSAPNRHAIYNGSVWEWDAAALLEDIRAYRGYLLNQSDWTQMPDNALSDEERTSWSAYRQQLRDILSTIDPSIDSVGSVNWPAKP